MLSEKLGQKLLFSPPNSDSPAFRSGFDRRWKIHFQFRKVSSSPKAWQWHVRGLIPASFPSLRFCGEPQHRATHEFASAATQIRQDGLELLRRYPGERGRLRLRRWTRALHSKPATWKGQAGKKRFRDEADEKKER